MATEQKQQGEYDYVIVGAGSAGCVLANRLSADPAKSVLLLEAGPSDDSWMVRIPLAILILIRSKLRNWQFETEPDAELGGRRLYWPRGRMLGGSSSINGMVYIRGQREDYDHWAELGNTGWDYASLLPVFKALECNERGASEYHGDQGELSVSDTRMQHPLSEIFLQACAEAGLPLNDDFNGATQAGAGHFQFTQKDGRRCSSSAAFLQPVLGRSNLTVLTGAHATRVLLEGKRAVGVAYQQSGRAGEARAGREVILCGGALQSPQLLQLSGIGPRAELEAQDLKVVHELPGVGENLQDHLDMCITQADPGNLGIHFGPSGLPQNLRASWQYLRDGRGNCSSALDAGAFLALGEGATRPDVQYHFFPTIIQDHARKYAYHAGYSLHACVLRPESRGRIGLRSADPLAAPAIHAGYLTSPADLELMKRAVREGRRIISQSAFDRNRGVEEMPGAAVQSDAELEAFIRAHAETIYHPVGSCKMGQDDLAVVDAELRVHGLEGLRVADASIMPTLISGNTNAPSIVIGERCAQAILAARAGAAPSESLAA